MEDFTAIVGPAVPLPPPILETFQLFFTSTLVSLIVDQTNTYAAQVLGEEASTKWSDVTGGDFLAFLGFVILMGINPLPALSHYWRIGLGRLCPKFTYYYSQKLHLLFLYILPIIPKNNPVTAC